MPNTQDEWTRRVEKAVETLGEAAAMGFAPMDTIVSSIFQKAKSFEGTVPQFGQATGMPQEPFNQMVEYAKQGRLSGR